MNDQLDIFEKIILSKDIKDKNLRNIIIDTLCVVVELNFLIESIRQQKNSQFEVIKICKTELPENNRKGIALLALVVNIYIKSLQTLKNKIGLIVKFKECLKTKNRFPFPKDISSHPNVSKEGKELLSEFDRLENFKNLISRRAVVEHKINEKSIERILKLIEKTNYSDTDGRSFIKEFESELVEILASKKDSVILLSKLLNYCF
ncbi:hypothetical protein A3J19_01430 [Candidatus Daviesbacteria bacterium RIFCSPLOWO2_02_FULL_41_8]|uniref:Uncharacterized protein n=2 Tax=Candidatus Daviesiibacteriota TaxID=1752718 RepID=A0A1F5NHQ4_9BACT|nr:MAG: hypothetical protein A2871_04345 [Candidatus Daviesbacteria bacterium RIFCSPHIGHO2_01_FULL_41_23]OGE62237.1 MAG: hypothetical protein A2967_02130 [Candidatus Daviesbacteria bacterium RIFCSPLOWO2_01_FULL_41_32]OGE77074.1 MAG: hypothetical protein A3J19_01430 [Candidatus Daviesbacteria bacterium RIFCSPLOWO2_02_FULL_41_8]